MGRKTSRRLFLQQGSAVAAAVEIPRLKARLREVGVLLDHDALPAISPRVDP